MTNFLRPFFGIAALTLTIPFAALAAKKPAVEPTDKVDACVSYAISQNGSPNASFVRHPIDSQGNRFYTYVAKGKQSIGGQKVQKTLTAEHSGASLENQAVMFLALSQTGGKNGPNILSFVSFPFVNDLPAPQLKSSASQGVSTAVEVDNKATVAQTAKDFRTCMESARPLTPAYPFKTVILPDRISPR